MRLICPDCHGELQMCARRAARCTQHGGEYEVLFDREAESLMRTAERDALAQETETKACAAHPRQTAIADCATCGKALCAVCSFDVGGRHYCSDCAVSGAKAAPEPTPPPPPRPVLSSAFSSDPVPSILSPVGEWTATPPLEGLKCEQHAESPVVARCRGCSSGVCETCDFILAGDIHICPQCIDRADDDEMSPRRKKFVTISIVLAVVSTLLLVLVMAGAFGQSEQAAGIALRFGVAGPAATGAGLALASREKHLRNTPLMWVAGVWNGLMVALIFVFSIIGILML